MLAVYFPGQILYTGRGGYRMELKNKLFQLRKNKGLTQLELAEALNVSRQTVSRWEVGTAVPTLDNLVILSRLYGVPLDDLIQAPVPAAPAKAPLNVPPPPPPKAGRLPAPMVSLLLAVLILGVGILIGINLPEKAELNHGERIMIDGPQSRLEQTPADIRDELQWLETTIKDMASEKDSLS